MALAQAFATHRDVGPALAEFKRVRRQDVGRFLSVAALSFLWYERMRDKTSCAWIPCRSLTTT